MVTLPRSFSLGHANVLFSAHLLDIRIMIIQFIAISILEKLAIFIQNKAFPVLPGTIALKVDQLVLEVDADWIVGVDGKVPILFSKMIQVIKDGTLCFEVAPVKRGGDSPEWS
jgi:hypothetical protein